MLFDCSKFAPVLRNDMRVVLSLKYRYFEAFFPDVPNLSKRNICFEFLFLTNREVKNVLQFLKTDAHLLSYVFCLYNNLINAVEQANKKCNVKNAELIVSCYS
jgi:hypothetical protein